MSSKGRRGETNSSPGRGHGHPPEHVRCEQRDGWVEAGWENFLSTNRESQTLVFGVQKVGGRILKQACLDGMLHWPVRGYHVGSLSQWGVHRSRRLLFMERFSCAHPLACLISWNAHRVRWSHWEVFQNKWSELEHCSVKFQKQSPAWGFLQSYCASESPWEVGVGWGKLIQMKIYKSCPPENWIQLVWNVTMLTTWFWYRRFMKTE